MGVKKICLASLVFLLYVSANAASSGLVATEGKPVVVRTYVRVVDPNTVNSSYEDTEDVKSMEDTKKDVETNVGFFDTLVGYIASLIYSVFSSLSAIGVK
ncbi:MAG: hypothetical protein FE038_02115 [Thermoplasmata archaeon]|nr:MAG: hypothetical protein FE038_02115 [Thermoplasmata archaeon]